MNEDGRVIATDYAPDVGWLEAGDQPEGTLIGPTWTVESEFSRDGEEYVLVQTLTFTSDGRVAFDAGCHTGVGSVSVEPGRIRVSDLVLGAVSCGSAVADLDAAAMAVFAANELRYTIDAGVLHLQAGSNSLQLQATYERPPG